MAIAELLNRALVNRGAPVIAEYDLFRVARALVIGGEYQSLEIVPKPMLRNRVAFAAIVRELLAERYLRPDEDFPRNVYRISDLPDAPAEDIAALVDPFCHISHLSAMHRYGLTNRIPEKLNLSTPAAWAAARDAKIRDDYGNPATQEEYRAPLVQPVWPGTLRQRALSIHRTRRASETRRIRDSFARITTIGETFVQMLDRPELCGGMPHVLDVWKEHALTYLREIITAVERSREKIIKVRAGYILSEQVCVQDTTVESWSQHAQRGGSRRLDSSRGYVDSYSKKWMISLNAGV